MVPPVVKSFTLGSDSAFALMTELAINAIRAKLDSAERKLTDMQANPSGWSEQQHHRKVRRTAPALPHHCCLPVSLVIYTPTYTPLLTRPLAGASLPLLFVHRP